MKKIYILFIIFWAAALSTLNAQRVIPSPRPDPNSKRGTTFDSGPVEPSQIKIQAPTVINFQQLADSESLHPSKKKRRVIEQGEDRERDFKFKGLPVDSNSISYDIPPSPPPSGGHLRNSPSPTGVWDGVISNGTTIPPDIRGAAGPTYVMETTNQSFKIYTKTGTLNSTLSINTFFSSSGGQSDEYFDPHIVYDNTNQRFIVCIAGNVSSGNSGLFVAVSQTSNPTGSWYVYGFDAVGNANDFLDYPLLGYNTNWVVITGNDFLGNGGVDSKIYVMNRASLYSGTLGTVSSFTDGNLFTIAPAQTMDPGQAIEYLVSDYNGNTGGSGYVRIGTITGTVNAPVYTSGTNLGVNQPWSESSVNAQQLGNTNRIEAGDTRIGNAVYINNSLWFCHNVYLPATSPSRVGVDWWQINPSALTITQFGRIEDSNGPKFFFYPSIAVNTNGDALLAYCQSSSSMYAGAAYSFHASTDAANSMQTTYLYKAGVAGYYSTFGGGRNRWGDYTGTAVDPSDNSFWGFGQWASASDRWGTEIVHVAASSTICHADAQFTYSGTVSCAAPLTVTFTNNSSSADTYLWYFGDGTTSAAVNPSHTYTGTGIFTVKLVATSSGTCGTDSVIVSNLVNIGPANPCVVILPATGTATTQSSCIGVAYDNGGISGNYTDNTNSTLTISPAGAAQVVLHFTQFAMESNYDFLYVYDGPTTASALIGSFTGATIPADITSSGSSITIRQTSDANLNDVGFAISWNCILANSPPVANFRSNFTSTCIGNVQFNDLTLGLVTSRLWNFGDGTTSTLQNPSHYYSANGTYTVTLTATNSFGSNTATKIGYITINKPAGPTVSADALSNCGPKAFTLTAAAGGNPVSWYDNSGARVSGSNPFTTPSLSATTTYYTEDSLAGSTVHVGPVNQAFGTGGYLQFSQYEIFNVLKPCVLQSVYVYAGYSGNRTFQLRNKSQVVLASAVVNVPNGGSRVTLNFNLSVGDSFQLGVPGTNMSLYRNDTSATYPYTDIDNNVSIIGNTANRIARYYFCYDWIIQEKCISLRSPITLTINPTVSLSSSATDVLCFGGNTGTATVTPSGGTPSFVYSWSNGATSALASNLSANTYNVTVIDAAGCSATASKNISQPAALTVSSTVTNALCNGANNGAVNLTVGGGTTAYAYNWGGGISTPNRTGLVAGNYAVTVTDAHLCTATSAATVNQPAAISISVSTTNAICNSPNGAATAIASGGTPGYTYHWNTGLNLAIISNLAVGNYTITATDINGCTGSASATISSSGTLNATGTSIAANCFGRADGSASIVVTNGTLPMIYSWSNGGTGASITNVSAGNYTVSATDALGCTATLTLNVSQPPALNVTLTATDAGCNFSNGSAVASASGGTSGYSYQWNNGATTGTVSNLPAANYLVTATDSKSCSVSSSVTILNTSSLVASIVSNDAGCYGSDNGSAAITISSGSAPYVFSWSNGGSTASINNLSPGNYFVTITDGSNCVRLDTAHISQPTSITVLVNVNDPVCYGSNNGNASVSATGGTPGYTYDWSNGLHGNSINSLSRGNYSVTVKDLNDCSSLSNFAINEPDSLVLVTDKTDISCNGDSNGMASVIVSGGTPVYTYNWCNGGNSSLTLTLPAGTCNVTITDQNGCSAVSWADIIQPNEIQLATSSLSATTGQNNGSASLDTVTGGTMPYSYLWSTGATTENIQNVGAGIYSIRVTDQNGCVKSTTVTVQEKASAIPNLTEEISFSLYPNPAYTEVYLVLNEWKEKTSFNIKDVLGQTLLSKSVAEKVTGIDLSLFSPGVYLIEVKRGERKAVKEMVVSK